MTKRGIDESLASSTFAGTASPQMNGSNGLGTGVGGGVLGVGALMGATNPIAGMLDPTAMLLDNGVVSTAAAVAAYQHSMLNGVYDGALGAAVMPDLKKIKIDHDQFGIAGAGAVGVIPNHPGGSTSTSPNSSSSSSGTITSGPVLGPSSSGGAAGQSKSRVIHIRNIPPETTANDLFTLASPFGSVTKHLLVKSKGQAFIEFDQPFSAMNMANYWLQTTVGGVATHLQPTIRGRQVHCQVSNHKELKTTFETTNNNDYDQSQPSSSRANGSSSMSNNNMNGGDHGGDSGGRRDHPNATTNTPSQVIRIVVENMLYSVSLDALYTIFSRTGNVQKIVTFTKNNVFQALVQFGDIASAIQAKLSLDGQNMFAGGANTLRIEYSKLQTLTVKYNNEKSRDYTQPGLSAGNFNSAGAAAGQPVTSSLNASAGLDTSSAHGQHHASGGNNSAATAVSDFNTLLAAAGAGQHHHHHQFSALSHAGVPFGSFGSSGNVQGLQAAVAAAAANQRYANAAALHAAGAGAGANSIHQALTNAALSAGLVGGPNAAMFAASAAAGAGLTGLIISPVIHVSGLSTEHTTPDALFTLFGVYGDVVRVKILFNKKDTALIQMAEATQAHLAISHLDRTKLYGKTLRVNTSKHQVVQMPKEGHQDSGLTKDYTNSPLHRFKRPGSKNYNNIYPPSETLHVSNIPPTVSEDELKASFLHETGKEVAKFKFFPNDRRMALVQFDCIEASILALIKMHNFKVAEHSHLRVSFSKSPV